MFPINGFWWFIMKSLDYVRNLVQKYMNHSLGIFTSEKKRGENTLKVVNYVSVHNSQTESLT